jgi:hypothetical protein
MAVMLILTDLSDNEKEEVIAARIRLSKEKNLKEA